MPHRIRLFRPVLAVVAAALALSAPLSAAAVSRPAAQTAGDTSDFEFRSFTGEYELSRAADGTSRLAVTETIVPVFPDFDQNRGILRAIPDLYQQVPLHTEVLSVQDAAGEAVPYEATWSDGFVELALGTDDFVRGEQTYVIEYTQRNVVGTFSDTDADEFYWDINGTGWDQPFAEVAAEVVLEQGLAATLTGDAACYVGAFGETTQCGIQQSDIGGATVFTARAAGLAPGETMTVAIGFGSGTFVPGQSDPDYVSRYQPQPPAWSTWVAIGGILLSALAALAAIVLRLLPDGGAKGRGTIIAEYSVPEDLNVMAAAHLVGKPRTAISAQLIGLAVRRRIRLLDYPVKGDAEYAVQLLDPTGVDALEARVLRALFGADLRPGESRDLPKTDTALAKALQKASKAAAKSLRTEGFVEPVPKWLRGGWLQGIVLVLVAVAFVNEVFAVPAGADSPWTFPAIAAAVVGFVLVTALRRKPTRLTEKGAERDDYLRGIRLYLEVAEEDRIRMLQSPEGAERVAVPERSAGGGGVDAGDRLQLVKLYERLLPFAVIWGVEKEWMDQLAVRMEEAHTSPDWFAGRNGFSSGAVIGTLHGVGRTASVTSTSSGSWSGSGGSSFSGGSGGGGFSGGGGGGGGGGGR